MWNFAGCTGFRKSPSQKGFFGICLNDRRADGGTGARLPLSGGPGFFLVLFCISRLGDLTYLTSPVCLGEVPQDNSAWTAFVWAKLRRTGSQRRVTPTSIVWSLLLRRARLPLGGQVVAVGLGDETERRAADLRIVISELGVLGSPRYFRCLGILHDACDRRLTRSPGRCSRRYIDAFQSRNT